MSDTIEDGFGSVWTKCGHPLCDLHVCRPGKSQCSDWCDYLEPEQWASKEHADQLISHIAWLEQLNSQLEDELDEQENA